MATRSKLADFEIISRLGSGSFGTVFKVKRHVDENLYVIKNVRIVELSFKEQSEAINEVQILAQLKSPFVVRYYDSFIEKDSLHIVMEFCNRGDLQNLIKKAKDKNVQGLKENVIWNITLQIMLGLYYLHKKHILHRDLKSANVFLMKDETKSHYLVKIGDLGVAKLMDTSTALANTIVGTPYYLSPELCADMPYRDKSDCWALGVIVFECATLQHPFEARNQCALIMKIIEASVKLPPSTVISAELRHLILWLLQKDPNSRPSIKDILNERVIRERLEEHQFELPEELRDATLTDALTNPHFDSSSNRKDGNGRHKGSGIQLMNMRHQEENRTNITSEKEKESNNNGVKKPAAVLKRENSSNSGGNSGSNSGGNSKDAGLRIGTEGSSPHSPSTNRAAGGIRRTGSTTSNIVGGGGSSSSSGEVGTVGLSVAGSGVAMRTNSNTNMTQSPHIVPSRAPSFRDNPSTGAPIRGDRVRGPSFNRRVPSEKALNRYQVKQPSASYSGTNNSRNSESKLDNSSDNEMSQQYKAGEDSGLSDPDSKLVNEEDDETSHTLQHATSIRRNSATTTTATADGKEASDYEEDFEEYDEEVTDPVHHNDLFSESQSAAQHHSHGNSFNASHKYTMDDIEDAQEKESIRRGGGLSRHTSRKMDSLADEKAEIIAAESNATLLRSGNHNRSMRFASDTSTGTASSGNIAHDPFHQTDESSLADGSIQYTNTMTGDSEMWDAVWTQRRGVITPGEVPVQEEHMYRQSGLLVVPEKVPEEGPDEEEEDGATQESDADISYVIEMIEDLKSGAIALLGEATFWKVYDLCVKYMDLPVQSDSTFNLVQELESILLEGGGSLEVACDVVFKVKSLLAFESRYNHYMLHREQGRA